MQMKDQRKISCMSQQAVKDWKRIKKNKKERKEKKEQKKKKKKEEDWKRKRS